MNLAEATTVMIVITTTIAGPVAVRSQGGPWWMALSSTLLSLPLGIGIGLLSGKIAFRCLFAKTQGFMSVVSFSLYCILPMFFLTAGMATAFWVFGWIAHTLIKR
jgi:hypothetical protein